MLGHKTELFSDDTELNKMSITKVYLQNPQTYGSKITDTSTTHGSKKK